MSILWICGCSYFVKKPEGESEAKAEMSDAEIAGYYGDEIGAGVADLRIKRQAALAAPQNMDAALAFGNTLFDMLLKNYAQVNGVDWKLYMKDAAAGLQSSSASPTAEPNSAAEALSLRAEFLGGLGEAAASVQSMRDAYARAHTYTTGIGMVKVYGGEKNYQEAQKMCESTRPLAAEPAEIFDLIESCINAVEPKDSNEAALPWVKDADWALFYKRLEQRTQERLAAREAEAERDAAQRQEWEEEQANRSQQNQGASTASRASSGPAYVSFNLHNTCPNTVKLFYGQTPKFGSGRSSSIGSNTSQNESMNEGDMIWIIDDNENGLSNFTASSGVREVEIGSSCTSFIVR
jgi:hypothetical protein